MNLYKYDTHLHTKESSACATISGGEQARIYKELGYTGIIITDHFFNGNSCVLRNLPWKERVEAFALGFEHALEEGQKIGLQVFFGWEESFFGTDFLVYGLDKHWLIEHPEILEWDIPRHYENIHKAGGYIVHAHPYRQADYITDIRLYPEYVDAIEIINGNNKKNIYNQKAIEYAKKLNKPVTGGSDAHHINALRGGMIFHHKLSSVEDFITSVNEKKDITVIPINI